MSRSSADPPKTAGQVNAYWRRRVIALAAGLGMLALVTWTVNGALGGGSPRQATNLSQTSGQRSSPPARSSTSATPDAASSAGATPSPTGDPAPTTSSSPKQHAPATKHPAKRSRKAAVGAAGTCPRADLVVSLTSPRYSYPAHARPRFNVIVVSTAHGHCAANLGATYLHVVIRAGGKNRVWDSADCAGSAAARATTLRRGVPAVVAITWSRKTSAPGCRAPHRAVRPGTYTATAYSGHLSSQAIIFVLKGRGIAVP